VEVKVGAEEEETLEGLEDLVTLIDDDDEEESAAVSIAPASASSSAIGFLLAAS
jgi:hypothetical protein